MGAPDSRILTKVLVQLLRPLRDFMLSSSLTDPYDSEKTWL